ncbi:MAG: hydrolase, partial [Oscillospiraceae bacterium]
PYPPPPPDTPLRACLVGAEMILRDRGGGVTRGMRVVNLANDAEHEGAFGVVVNAPTSNEVVHMLKQVLDIPVVVTVVSGRTDVAARIEAGADILNISGAQHTPGIVRKVREQFPDVPIIATGGPTEETILETIRAGANAITYTPPTNGELFAQSMARYRRELDGQEL